MLHHFLGRYYLDAATGGRMTWWYDKDADANNCTSVHEREIYGGGGFPNCAATVEDGSWCGSNDACYNLQVDYYGFVGKDCAKAWR